MNILCRPVGLFHINADNGHIQEISFLQTVIPCTKSVDMLLHVTAGKLICADNGETIMGRFTGGGEGLLGILVC
jgi:hypothetical protein